ncbi:hypothetical protein RE6C_01890 [Rhodopirellula europaea 6C]|uniref:Uncharacterized protein n=1 Tax=Rhodopirellula europaea 6C TaxID=1263867 RepID=M2AXB3_9BACT|nr:hypothetical protein RE6C_01890 [Rhodopirellula europaea 6C]
MISHEFSDTGRRFHADLATWEFNRRFALRQRNGASAELLFCGRV